MLDMAATAADRLGQILTDEFKRNFGSGHSDRAERLGSIARVAKIRRHAVELVALSPDVGIGGGPANIDSRIATIVPAQLRQCLDKRCYPSLLLRIIRGRTSEHRNPPHAVGLLLLASRGPRSPDCSACKSCDEFAPPHSITSSARARSVGGIVRPSAFAVFRLMTSSNFEGHSMGRSAGLSPLKIRSTKLAARV